MRYTDIFCSNRKKPKRNEAKILISELNNKQ